jgi:FkbM family methyltransferase
MNFPGKKRLRHWFWILAFKYPWLRVGLTRLIVPSRDIDVEIFGTRLRINTREEIGLWRAGKMADENVVFRDEVASLLNLALLLQPDDTFVDVGANVGLYSAVLSRFCNVFPRSACVAIEANPSTAARLQQSVAKNGVKVLNLGASDRTADLVFEPGVTSGVFRVAPDSSTVKGTRIRCQRLDALSLPGEKLVVKIDVEGHEWPVLQGASGLFASERIKVIYLDGYTGSEIPSFLREQGFTLFDGHTLARCDTGAPEYALLGIHRTRLNPA